MKATKIMYSVTDTITGNEIALVPTKEWALAEIEEMETEDKQLNIYEPNSYIIEQVEVLR